MSRRKARAVRTVGAVVIGMLQGADREVRQPLQETRRPRPPVRECEREPLCSHTIQNNPPSAPPPLTCPSPQQENPEDHTTEHPQQRHTSPPTRTATHPHRHNAHTAPQRPGGPGAAPQHPSTPAPQHPSTPAPQHPSERTATRARSNALPSRTRAQPADDDVQKGPCRYIKCPQAGRIRTHAHLETPVGSVRMRADVPARPRPTTHQPRTRCQVPGTRHQAPAARYQAPGAGRQAPATYPAPSTTPAERPEGYAPAETSHTGPASAAPPLSPPQPRTGSRPPTPASEPPPPW
jgi:hypothetical protein